MTDDDFRELEANRGKLTEEALMQRLPAGLYQSGGRYVVRYKQNGKWTNAAAGTDLATALDTHRRLRGETAQEALPGATFGDLVEAWLQREQRRRNKPRTVETARMHAARLERSFGRALLAEHLTAARISQFIEQRRRSGVSASTINVSLRILRAIVRFAAEHRLMREAPKVKLLRAPARKDVVPFTPDELAAVMERAEPRVRALLAIAASSGLRTGEILWLRWSDLEADGTLHVREKTDRVRLRGEWKELHWSPKSHQARTVVLPAATMAELAAYRAKREFAEPGDWIFQSTRRRRARWGGGSRKALQRAFREAGLYEPHRLIHAIRHSFATAVANAGVSIETLRTMLGHSSVAVTAGYLHTDKRQIAEAARRGSLLR